MAILFLPAGIGKLTASASRHPCSEADRQKTTLPGHEGSVLAAVPKADRYIEPKLPDGYFRDMLMTAGAAGLG